MNCPRCAAPVPASQVIDQVAQCAACDFVFEPPSRRGLGPPAGVLLQSRSPERIVLSLPWSVDNRFHHVLWLFIVVPLVFTPGLQAILFSLFALALWASIQFNVTRVVITPRGVAVSHRYPSLTNRNVQVPAEKLAGLRVQQQQHARGFEGINDQVDSFYSLVTADRMLLRTWSTEEKIAYVREAIAEIHGHERLASDTPLPVPMPPAGVTATQTANGVKLTLPWNAEYGYVVHLYGLLGLLSLGVGPIRMLIAGTFLTVWAYLFFNTTVVTVDRKGMHIENGPLPTPWEPTRRLSAADAGRLDVQKHLLRFGRAHWYFNLYTGGRRLLWGWTDPGKLTYIEMCAKQLTSTPEPTRPQRTARKSLQDRIAAARGR